MGKKKFEETEYDPFEAEARRVLARSVSQANNNNLAPNLVVLPAEREERRETQVAQPSNAVGRRREKKRTFSCANVEQDIELEAFLLRLEEASGTHIPFQVLMRASCMAVQGAEEQIMGEIKRMPTPPFPAKQAKAAYAKFEDYWTEILRKAMRKGRG